MAKPILHIKIKTGKLAESNRFKLMREAVIDKTNDEYHCLISTVYCENDDVTIDCLNVKDATEVNIRELQELIYKELENNG